MKILITGGTGMLGHKLVQVLGERFETYTTIRGKFPDVAHYGIFRPERTYEAVDVTDYASVAKVLESVRPDVIVNAVGVIKQKPESKDIIRTLEINSIFPHRLARSAEEIGARLITYGTDCIFLGDRGNYREDDPADAPDLYGRSKHLGEISGKNLLTLRTSIIGRELNTSDSLVEWFLSRRQGTVRGFTNAIYSGFPTIVSAEIVARIIEHHPRLEGVYHLAAGPISKYDLLELIRARLDLDIRIEPAGDFRIDRSLDAGKFRRETNFQPPDWTELIDRMCSDPTPYDGWRSHSV
jgi:dTDP-4-dehydrorhamnose reductase